MAANNSRWHTFHGSCNEELLVDLTHRVAHANGATAVRPSAHCLSIVSNDGGVMVELRWREAAGRRQDATLAPASGGRVNTLELHLIRGPAGDSPIPDELIVTIRNALLPFSDQELAQIRTSMPLVQQSSSYDEVLARWALVFRDHYLEHSVGFLDGMHRAGIPAQWVLALAKGDRTRNRERIHATFVAAGFRSGLLDNAQIPVDVGIPDAPPVCRELDDFIAAARAESRPVLVVDDGGLLALGYGTAGARFHVDAAIELTVSGLKRIRSVRSVDIPIVNMARSTIKTVLGYPEIADSCFRRIRELLPVHKFVGRPVLLIGYGHLGSRLSARLRGLGVRLSVVDDDVVALISAAEMGFATFRSVRDALTVDPPFLIVSAAGERVLDLSVLSDLPDGVFLAPFATRDFSVCAEPAVARYSTEVPGIGRRFHLPTGNSFVVLGDGRSLNLFEADSIPNGGYDAYRAGTILAAKRLVREIDVLRPGINDDLANEAVTAAGLLEDYYNLHLSVLGRVEKQRIPG